MTIQNNRAIICGKFVSNYTYSHEKKGVKFYIAEIGVKRSSGFIDIIPTMFSEENVNFNPMGILVKIDGQFRSYNRHDEYKNRLMLSVFAREIEFIDSIEEDAKTNQIFLDGFICKEPTYRETPSGREISDLLIAVNRPYGKSDYIPCIAWGRNARYISQFSTGTRIQLGGRIQSREYSKQINDTEFDKKIAYEVSVSRIDVVKESEETE